ARHFRRERARQGAPREPQHAAAGARGRLRYLREGARWRARRALGAVCRRAEVGCTQQRKADQIARRQGQPARALLLRGRFPAPRGGSRTGDRRRNLGGRDRRRGPRRERVRLRPAFFPARLRQDRRRARSRAKKSREPPRQGAAAAAGETEGGRLMPDHPGGLRPPPLLKGGGENNILSPAGIPSPAGILSPSGTRLGVLPPLALYVHIPWCVKKCPYCDFNSHQARGDVPEQAYVEALVTDLELALPDVWGRRVHSIFFGGGTPSLFSAAAIETLISAFRARLQLAADCEITLEANPGTFEAGKFRGYREAGVNRLSIGIQSFDPGHLKALGRIHDDREARRAIEIAQNHFDNINLDLMYALPRQTPDEARSDAEAGPE